MLGSKLRIDGFFTRKDPAKTLDEAATADLCSEQVQVLERAMLMQNTLMHGPAGTGKSVALRRLVTCLVAQKIRYALTALTGAAAVNIGGTTVHSFFKGCGLMKGTAKELAKKIRRNAVTALTIRQLQLLVVDEISMMSAPFLDKINRIFQLVRGNEEPFGGCALLFCGDFYQLPPIETSETGAQFAFEADCWKSLALQTVEMHQVFRQSDMEFVNLLHRLRVGKMSMGDQSMLISRVERKVDVGDTGVRPTTLFPTNAAADRVNNDELDKLPGSLGTYDSSVTVTPKPGISDTATKELFRTSLAVCKNAPVPDELRLKVGAQVMLRTNLDLRAGLANGSRGVVESFDTDKNPVVRFIAGCKRTILPNTFDFQFPFGTIQFTQLPLMLAWAMTVHKSQGCTLDAAAISVKGMRTAGHLYVALSRLRSLEGLELLDYNMKAAVTDQRVLDRFPVVPPEDPIGRTSPGGTKRRNADR